MTKYNRALKCVAYYVLTLSLGIASPVLAESAEHYIDDATITAKVKEAIFADSQLKVLQVVVDTSHGAVMLSGSVDTKAQESEALYVTSHVNGVVAVTDKILVKSAQTE